MGHVLLAGGVASGERTGEREREKERERERERPISIQIHVWLHLWFLEPKSLLLLGDFYPFTQAWSITTKLCMISHALYISITNNGKFIFRTTSKQTFKYSYSHYDSPMHSLSALLNSRVDMSTGIDGVVPIATVSPLAGM